jgi:hypothetical protein
VAGSADAGPRLELDGAGRRERLERERGVVARGEDLEPARGARTHHAATRDA